MTDSSKPSPTLHIETDAVDEFKEVLDEVLEQVLGLAPNQVLLTDLSQLSDFSGTGLPEALARECQDLAQLYNAWDAWVLARLAQVFGLEPAHLSPRMRMLDLAVLIEAGKNRTTH